ncbi:choline transporter-like protein [Achlya hypogyna]|uniref:Choline transporter-like protein n=1 Tax=Achlya hypogyna TaxID=1202772 RepID=A0A1V9Z516_ACHHY|nr:choline transporter-like protein [Achlya hypogyna]
MGCCGGKEDVLPDGTGGVVPNSTRKCRDVLCCLLFVVFWIGMIILAILGLTNGSPESLIYGTDFNGTVCGTGSTSSQSLTYYPRMTQDMLAQAARGIQPLDMKFYGLCVAACPAQGDYICSYAAEAVIRAANPGADAAKLKAERKKRADSLSSSADCWFVPLPSEVVAFRCLPLNVVTGNTTVICVEPANAPEYYDVVNGVQTPNSKCQVSQTVTISASVGQAHSDPVMEKLQTTLAIVGRFVGDIQKTYAPVLAIGGGGALALGWLFLFFMRCCAGCVIWLTLLIVVAVLAGLSVFFLLKGGIISNSDVAAITTQINTIQASATVSLPASLSTAESNIKAYQVAAVISLFLTVAMLLIVCFMRKRIKIAIGIIHEASRTIQRLPLLVIFPVFPAISSIVLFIYTTVIGAFIYSAGGSVSLPSSLVSQLPGNLSQSVSAGWDAELNATSSAVQPNQRMQIMIAYHAFGFLWTNQLIQAVSMTTIAGAVCRYYWSREHSRAEMGRFPILGSFKNCFRYHIGSLAMGSFIIAVVQFLRAVLMYVDKQTKSLQQSNLAVKVAMKVVACCLYCLEKCLKFISKNAYIMIAMKGRSFCSSTKEAFMLLFANMAQVATTSMIINLVAFVATVAISVGCALLLFLYLQNDAQFKTGGSHELSSVFPPCLIGLVLAWFVGASFIGVYEMCVDTILLCFCEDRRINQQTGMYYMSKELQAFVDKTAKKSKSSPSAEKVAVAVEEPQVNADGSVDV